MTNKSKNLYVQRIVTVSIMQNQYRADKCKVYLERFPYNLKRSSWQTISIVLLYSFLFWINYKLFNFFAISSQIVILSQIDFIVNNRLHDQQRHSQIINSTQALFTWGTVFKITVYNKRVFMDQEFTTMFTVSTI